jgi:hypothetical protein
MSNDREDIVAERPPRNQRFDGPLWATNSPNALRNGSLRQARGRQKNNDIKWLPFLDIYRTMCIAPSPDFLRALEGISALRVAA